MNKESVKLSYPLLFGGLFMVVAFGTCGIILPGIISDFNNVNSNNTDTSSNVNNSTSTNSVTPTTSTSSESTYTYSTPTVTPTTTYYKPSRRSGAS